jgi:hypothetical protein
MRKLYDIDYKAERYLTLEFHFSPNSLLSFFMVIEMAGKDDCLRCVLLTN